MKSVFKLTTKKMNKSCKANIYIWDRYESPTFRPYLNVIVDGENIQSLSFSLSKKKMKELAEGILKTLK